MTAKLPEDNDFRLGEGSSDDACSTDWENRGLDWKKKKNLNKNYLRLKSEITQILSSSSCSFYFTLFRISFNSVH